MSIIELETVAREYRELQAAIKDLDDQLDSLKQQMIREMDNRQCDKLPVGPFEIRYTLVESSRLDSTALKQQMPEIAAQFTKSSTSTRFQVA